LGVSNITSLRITLIGNKSTWRLTLENILEPPKLLAEARKKLGVSDDAFTTCDIGETVIIEETET
jgi:hypothetical protein